MCLSFRIPHQNFVSSSFLFLKTEKNLLSADWDIHDWHFPFFLQVTPCSFIYGYENVTPRRCCCLYPVDAEARYKVTRCNSFLQNHRFKWTHAWRCMPIKQGLINESSKCTRVLTGELWIEFSYYTNIYYNLRRLVLLYQVAFLMPLSCLPLIAVLCQVTGARYGT